MARGYLRWPVQRLAKEAGVGVSTIQRMEQEEGVPSASAKNLEAVERVLKANGIEFVGEDEIGGVGVRLRKQ